MKTHGNDEVRGQPTATGEQHTMSGTRTHGVKPHPSVPGRIRRALRLVGWNALFLVAGLALIGVVGETYFRWRTPFVESVHPNAWSPTAGRVYTPNAEVRHTNGLDFWTESRTNSLGFVDREPIGLERAAASCHVAMIGDSYVEALQVPIADKFHVRLEELAARELRHLDVTTSAFGIFGTGQVNQLAYYDEFARYLRPALLVLVFVSNDFMNNAPILEGLNQGVDPDRLKQVSATRGADGTITLRPPLARCGSADGRDASSTLAYARHGPPDRRIPPRELAGCQEARFFLGRHRPRADRPGGAAEPALPPLRRAARRVAANDAGRHQ